MPYCCNCGERLANSVHNETGASSATESFICSECDWEAYCKKSENDGSYCSLCGEFLKTYEQFETHGNGYCIE